MRGASAEDQKQLVTEAVQALPDAVEAPWPPSGTRNAGTVIEELRRD